MKAISIFLLNLFLLIILVASCQQGPKLTIGDCIQKPDEVQPWKIINEQNDVFIAGPASGGQEIAREIKKSETWVKVNCP